MIRLFTGKPLEYKDVKSGIVFLLKEPTDEVECELLDLEATFPADEKERAKLFKNRIEFIKWLNVHINFILIDWKNAEIKFPTSNPAGALPWELKLDILAYFRKYKSLGKEDLKK